MQSGQGPWYSGFAMANTIKTAANLLTMRRAAAPRPRVPTPPNTRREPPPTRPAVGILLVEELPDTTSDTMEIVHATVGAVALAVAGYLATWLLFTQ